MRSVSILSHTYLDNIGDKIRKDFILLDLIAIVSNLFLHNTLLMLQPQSLGTHNLSLVLRLCSSPLQAHCVPSYRSQ
jgi:hypothetical protein